MARPKGSKNKAKDKDQSAQGQAAQHNAGARKDIMRECAEAMRRIIALRKDLNEEAGDIRERMKDAGINVKAWEAALRLSNMEDDAARDDYLDGLRESFEALGVGAQAEMFPTEAMGGKGAPEYLSGDAETAGTA